ncbi:MAG: hypothetical protein R2686_04720 [Candidatus Nanopelagicales bacterium]
MLEAQASAGLPRNGRLVMDYSKWSPKKPRGIRAFVQARGKRTPVRLQIAKSAG